MRLGHTLDSVSAALSAADLPSFQIAVTTYLIFLFSITVHEFSHAASAAAFGDKTARDLGRLTLNPVPHMDLFGTVLLPVMGLVAGGFVVGYASTPVRPSRMRRPRLDDVLVSLAGPTANLATCIAAIAAGRILTSGGGPASGSLNQALLGIVTTLALLNAFLFLFNLMPVPPLDGSRVVRSLLGESARASYDRFAGVGVLLMFGVVYLLGGYVFAPITDGVQRLIGG